MDDGQLMVCLPHILTKIAFLEYQSTSLGSLACGLSSWKKTGKYLLRTYTVKAEISEASDKLESLRKSPTETENALRIKNTAYRCRNVNTDIENIPTFIRGLFLVVQPIVRRCRFEYPRYKLRFTLTISFSSGQGNACLASKKKATVRSVFPPKKAMVACANTTLDTRKNLKY